MAFTIENVMQFSTVIGQFAYCLRLKVLFHVSLKPIVWATKRITWRLLSLNYYNDNFYAKE